MRGFAFSFSHFIRPNISHGPREFQAEQRDSFSGSPLVEEKGGLHQGGPELAVATAEQGEGAERGQAPG